MSDAIVNLILVAVPMLIGLYFYDKKRKSDRLNYIEDFRFNNAIGKKLVGKYPHLSPEQASLVLDGLRDYFYICSQANGKMVSMPSQVVDVAWHEFILFTRDYENYCKKTFRRFLHHTPTEAMKTPTLAQEGIKRAWRLSCVRDQINPQHPTRLPLLFAIDEMLNIEDGFKYSLNCQDRSSPNYGDGYCAAHIGCASGCTGSSGNASDAGGGFFGGDSNGCSSGCGGGD